MKTLGKLALALGAFALIAGTARAQPPGTYGPGRGVGGFIMLRNKSVQQELKATPEQAGRLDALFHDMFARFQKDAAQLNGLPQEDRRPKFMEQQRAQREDLHKSLDGILKPEQVKRFDQIDVQQAGVQAFEMRRVQEKLKLTDGQKAEMQRINREMMGSLADLLSRGAARSGDIRKDTEELVRQVFPVRAQALVKCIAVLTDEQKATWNDLNGEPFVIVVE